jgi:predicted  nucleic acid-binding Zn-ribbon protein
MGGGGGGGGYDDQWIRDWTKNAEKVRDNFGLYNQHRFNETQANLKSIKNIEKLNKTQGNQILKLQGNQSNLTKDLRNLGKDFSGLSGDFSGLQSQFSDLEKLVNTPTTTGDVKGLDKIISNLQSRYSDADSAIGDLSTQLSDTEASIRGDTKSQLDKAIKDLGIKKYMKTSTFNERMEENLDTLGKTLRGEFGADIAALDLPGVNEAIKKAEGDLGKLSTDFAGLSDDMDWIKTLDLGSFDDRLTAQASDFSDRITSAEDRFSDLLGGQTDNLTDLISESEGRLQSDLDSATTARERLAGQLTSGLREGSEARDALAKQLKDQGYNIDNLSTQLLGYGDRLTEYQDQFQDDLTDLRGIVGTERELELGKLEDQIGQDRAADLLQLRQGIEEGTISEIERMAGNLRQEYGDKLFDLSDTFDKGQEENKLARQELGADIQDLFGRSLAQDVSVAGLTSNVGTLGQNLDSLKSSFGDFKLDAATNLGNVRRALEGEIGDLSGSLTSGLSDLRSDYVDRILGTERAGATARDELRSDLTGALGSETAAREAGLASEAAARQSGLATEASAREAGLATEASAREAGLQSAQAERTRLAEEASRGFQDVYKTREQAIADLSGRFGENLRAQEESLGRRIDDTSKAVDEKIGRLGSMMNYRMLGDSAGGVKMRRSKAYKSGAVNTGTGQLSRSMKLKTLNI